MPSLQCYLSQTFLFVRTRRKSICFSDDDWNSRLHYKSTFIILKKKKNEKLISFRSSRNASIEFFSTAYTRVMGEIF